MKITYRIAPSNYDTLPDDEKDQKLRALASVLCTLKRRLDIVIIGRETKIAEKSYMEKQIYFTSAQDTGVALAHAGFQISRLDRPFGFEVRRERLRYLETDDGRCLRVYSLYDMPQNVHAAWINLLYDICGAVQITISPVGQGASRRMLLSHANTLEMRGAKRFLDEAIRARYVNDLIQKQESMMYSCTISAMVSASSVPELHERCAGFERIAGWRFLKCRAVSGRQRRALSGWGHEFLFDLGSCSAFYPFESSDLIESDGAGVYLGVNGTTGAPVIYDYQKRLNHNVVVIGESGSGKSTTVKTYLDGFLKMLQKRYGSGQRAMICIIDPHGEYAHLASRLSAVLVDLTARDELGMDPFRLMEHSDQAVSMLCETVGMPEDLRSLLLSRSEGCKSVEDIIRKLSNETGSHKRDCIRASAYLMQFHQGGLSRMFRGTSSRNDRTIYSMRKAEKSRANAMLISMAMQKTWLEMRDAPPYVPKLFLIDEGWFLLSMDVSASILRDIAKSGRKENVHLIFLTQEPEDLLSNEYGRAMIDNSATIILHRLKPRPAGILQKALNLSDAEVKSILHLDVGSAMLRADAYRIKLHISPSTEQMKLFKTGISPQ